MYIYNKKTNEWIRRDSTRQYRRRKNQLKNVWIGLGLFMLFIPPVAAVFLALFALFLSLSYLDETPYSPEE